jgi:phospholipid-translocating ATPase
MADVFENPIVQISESSSFVKSVLNSAEPSESGTSIKKTKKKGGLRREESSVVRDLVSALALCHNVTPTFPDPENPDVGEYQASSPDEIALVKFADSLDMRLIERD